MKNIFKITCAILTAMFLSGICAKVSAHKENWIDKTYNFSDVRSVFICEVEDSAISTLNDELNEKIQLASRKFENKIKRPILDEESENLADVKIVIKIVNWENKLHHSPKEIYYEGWYSERIRDKNGEWKTKSYFRRESSPFQGSHKVTIPERYWWRSYIEVNFEVYDVKTGKLIMSRNDKRERRGKGEQINMFERICKSFFQDFAKKLK